MTTKNQQDLGVLTTAAGEALLESRNNVLLPAAAAGGRLAVDSMSMPAWADRGGERERGEPIMYVCGVEAFQPRLCVDIDGEAFYIFSAARYCRSMRITVLALLAKPLQCIHTCGADADQPDLCYVCLRLFSL